MGTSDPPTFGEAIAAILSLVAAILIGYLAVWEDSAGAQTALISLLGAAVGTWFLPRGNGNGNGNGSKPPGSGTPPLPPSAPP